MSKNSKWGTLISSAALKDGSVMYAYRDGDTVNFVVNDEVEKSFKADDVGEIMGALLGIEDGSGF